jgi:hypothetical protein
LPRFTRIVRAITNRRSTTHGAVATLRDAGVSCSLATKISRVVAIGQNGAIEERDEGVDMANQLALEFQVQFLSDGTSTTLAVNMSTGPVGYSTPGSGNVFDNSLVVTATGFGAMGTDYGATVTAEIFLGVATFTLSYVAPEGSLHNIYGTLLF